MITLENIINFIDSCVNHKFSIHNYGYDIIIWKFPKKDEVTGNWQTDSISIYYHEEDNGELTICINGSNKEYEFVRTNNLKEKALWTLCLDRVNNYNRDCTEKYFNSFINGSDS